METNQNSEEVKTQLQSMDLEIISYKKIEPSIEDVFIELMET